MLLLAWLVALAGAAVAWIVSLAGAMKTVPRLHWQEAIVGLPLPLLAAALALWCLLRRPLPPRKEPPFIAASLALLLAALTLLFLAITYFDQPEGPL
jgi:hypothetical protein